ncbi:MAG: SOS response-associated peptidase family protein [Devosia sp.]|nr:SOS response-associated peptidase family protein [Devosia sp.]
MCEQYSITTNRQAMRRISERLGLELAESYVPRASVRRSDEVLVLRNRGTGLEWAAARFGMPTPVDRLKPGARVDRGIANIANPRYPHWRQWLGPANRCVVPATSFIEHNSADGTYAPIEFAFAADRPMFFFAGLWTPWTGVRRVKEGVREMDLFGILTIGANADVAPYHGRMPVILLTPEEVGIWLTAPTAEALRLQLPLPDGSLIFAQSRGTGTARTPAVSGPSPRAENAG